MAQPGDAEGFVRDGAAEALILLLASDRGILDGLRTNPETTLWNYGFALSPRELESVRSFIQYTSAQSFEETLNQLQQPESESLEFRSLAYRRRWP